MPDELWAEATSLAEQYGISKVSNALKLNSRSLKKRVESNQSRGPRETLENPSGFVELSGNALFGPLKPLGSSLELQRADGSRLIIHFGSADRLDAASVIASFMGSVG